MAKITKKKAKKKALVTDRLYYENVGPLAVYVKKSHPRMVTIQIRSDGFSETSLGDRPRAALLLPVSLSPALRAALKRVEKVVHDAEEG